VKIVKAFRFRLKTNEEIEGKLNSFCGATRFVWNKVLALNLAKLQVQYHLKAGEKSKLIWYNEMSFWLTLWKNSEQYSFLKYCPAQVLQQKLKDLDKAFRDGFDKKQTNKRLPTWRKKDLHNSFRYPQGFKIDGKRIYLPRIGWVNFCKSQEIVGKAKNLTISKSGGHWYIAVQTECVVSKPQHQNNNNSIAIDLGVASFASLSDGRQITSPRPLSKYAKKLARTQRRLAKKKRRSEMRKKLVVKLSKLHQKIANIRKDFLHKLSTEICKNHANIYVEDLIVTNMSKSAKGTIENPGKNVKAKSGLNRAILDQGWGEFRRQLTYKAAWLGGKVISVSAKYTSQTCSNCGHTDKANRKSQEKFACTSCGFEKNADLNAAANILASGQLASACGENRLRSSAKQEPARKIA